jgi:hypothetical protein
MVVVTPWSCGVEERLPPLDDADIDHQTSQDASDVRAESSLVEQVEEAQEASNSDRIGTGGAGGSGSMTTGGGTDAAAGRGGGGGSGGSTGTASGGAGRAGGSGAEAAAGSDGIADASDCDSRCAAIANGTVGCNAQGCYPASCDIGFSPCGKMCLYTDGDPQNCGGCGLKCPAGSLCKGAKCEVRLGYPDRFLGVDPYLPSADEIRAFAIDVTKTSTMTGFGYINSSTSSTAIASFGLYTQNANQPGSRITSVVDVNLKSSIQEIPIAPIVLIPGTYYIAILTRDNGEPKLFTSPMATTSWFVSTTNYSNGLPSLFGAVAPEVFTMAEVNLYIVVTQAAM